MGSSVLPNEAFETFNYPEYVLRLQKERQIRQNIKKSFIFYVKNPCGRQ